MNSEKLYVITLTDGSEFDAKGDLEMRELCDHPDFLKVEEVK